MIHIYTGKGKGKTTASIGLAIRMLGAGKKVLFIQFFKDGRSSESKIFKKFKRFKYLNFQFPEKNVFKYLKKLIEKNNYDLVVLDEVLIGLQWKVFSLKDIIEILDDKREWVLTGRKGNLRNIYKIADYITEMKEVRHPYKKGIKARKGVEY